MFEPALGDLQTRIRGTVLRPGDDGYDSSRRIFNAAIDRRPALIVRVAETDDVIASVNYARVRGLPLAVRGGGHNVAGNALCDDGLVVDFSGMRAVRVDPPAAIARVEAGATWGDVDAATQAFGLATPGGLNTTTGVAGFTLGGGIGWLMGRYGLTCDNLLSAEVVTAEGRVLTASATENPDLFWGLRGGGGNFGIVTSFEFRLYPLREVYAGSLSYPVECAGDALRALREFDPGASDNLGLIAAFKPAPVGGAPVFSIGICYAGASKDGEAAIAPLRGRPIPVMSDTVRRTTYLEHQRSLDYLWPHGLYCYWKSGFFETLSDELVETMFRFFRARPSPRTVVACALHHGAATRVPSDATAFAHRARLYNLNIQAQWTDPGDTQSNLHWIRDFWAAAEPHLTKRVYVNFLSQEAPDRVQAAYGENYDRLVALKTKYDPGNFFRFNQNIPPRRD